MRNKKSKKSRSMLLQEAKAIRVNRNKAVRKANADSVRKMAKKYNCSERRIYRVLNNEILL